ncbi:MAG: ABC transporter ATP-binding protein [Desulfobacteraceae bacterium]|nr:MAG: ABC transporter ATP-binding protein [Desulfobacteraceae bacterium]
MAPEILKVVHLNKSFGRVKAASNVNFALQEGVLTSIIGPNGAGKSTLINILSGSQPADTGRVFFYGTDITRLSIHRRVQMGLCRSFQLVNIFPEMTVFDNLQLPALAVHRRTRQILRSLRKEAAVHLAVEQLLDRIGLKQEAGTVASALSHGDQRVLEVGVALAAQPKLLFLDEPTAGMNPVERVRILDNIRRLSKNKQTTFVIVEHDMDVVFSLSERIIVLHQGEIIGDGTTEEVRNNPRVREVYLGQEVAA